MQIVFDARPVLQNQAGIGRYTTNLLRALSQIDSNNTYVLLVEKNIQFPFMLGKNFYVVPIPCRGIWWHFTVLKKYKAQTPDFYYSPSSLIVPAFAHFPCGIMIHDLSAIKYPQWHKAKTRFVEILLMQKALTKSKLILTPSQATKRDIIENFPRLPTTINVIPHGIESTFTPAINERIDELSNLSNKYILKDWKITRNNYYLFVGTLEPRKNITNLLVAFYLYKQQGGQKKLLIVGQKGWFYQSLFSLQKKLHLQSDCYFLHEISSSLLPLLYSFAFALIYPSLYEGFGFPVLEAMACGCPVITSQYSSMLEVGNHAVLQIDPVNPEDITKRIFELESTPALQKDLRKKGLERAQQFSWEKTAKQTLMLFKQHT